MLVEKYEALLKIQEQQQGSRQRIENGLSSIPSSKSNQCMSLRDELQLSGNYYDGDKKYMTDSELEDDETQEPQHGSGTNNHEMTTTRPLFADSMLHKGTQTEVLAVLPGSFLCKISDGSDCQFSIYDDASPVESRFRKTPEYRQLFKEIFAVLKRAAEAKDEGESLPLLDDRLPHATPHALILSQPKVPPVTPAKEEQPFIPPEYEKSEISRSVNQSSLPHVPKEVEGIEPKESKPVSSEVPISETTTNKPSRPDIMEQLMEGVRPVNEKKTPNRDRKALSSVHRASPSPSPCSSRSNSKRRAGSKTRRKRDKITDSPNHSRERHQQKSNRTVETFNKLEIFDKAVDMANTEGPCIVKKERPVSMFVFSSGSTSASKEVAKLKILEKSYAEVLRMGRKKNASEKVSFM